MSVTFDTICLRNCLHNCQNHSKQHRENYTHDHSLDELIYGNSKQINYRVARQIIELFLQTDIYKNDSKWCNNVDGYYGTVLYHTATSRDEYKKCVKHLEKAISSRKPKHRLAKLCNLCAITYENKLKQNNKAQEYYLQALGLEPSYGAYNRNYASFLCERTNDSNRFSKSMAYWMKGDMDSQHRCAVHLYVYGKALYNLLDFHNSIKYLNKAIAKDNSYAIKCGRMLKPARETSHLVDLCIQATMERKSTKDIIDVWYNSDNIGVHTLLHCLESLKDESQSNSNDIKKYFETKFNQLDNMESKERWQRKRSEISS